MKRNEGRSFTAFLGQRIIATGKLESVLAAAKGKLDAGSTDRLAIFDDEEARIHDFDFRGDLEEVLARLHHHPLLLDREESTPAGDTPRRGPGRPKLGVVSKEVTLLPRHWEWLGRQRGGASATLRRLVEEARKRESPRDREIKAREATYRFMSDMAANLPGYEEASRALFAGDYEALAREMRDWPSDIRGYVSRLLEA